MLYALGDPIKIMTPFCSGRAASFQKLLPQPEQKPLIGLQVLKACSASVSLEVCSIPSIFESRILCIDSFENSIPSNSNFVSMCHSLYFVLSFLLVYALPLPIDFLPIDVLLLNFFQFWNSTLSFLLLLGIMSNVTIDLIAYRLVSRNKFRP